MPPRRKPPPPPKPRWWWVTAEGFRTMGLKLKGTHRDSTNELIFRHSAIRVTNDAEFADLEAKVRLFCCKACNIWRDGLANERSVCKECSG